jgi:hypothetical protein
MVMETFKNYIAEQSAPHLFIWDIDETLFQTNARIHVNKGGKRIKSLSNTEYNTYKFKKGEKPDFSEFRRADIFHDTSTPIMPAIRVAAKLLKTTLNNPGSKMIIVTARGDFDDKSLFLKTFEKYGLNMKNVYVERSGKLNLPTAEGKRVTIKKYLDTGVHKFATQFDDAESNLSMFKNLSREYPNIKFTAYKADHGTLTKV